MKLQEEGLFSEDDLSSQIALLVIYMPIIRQEMAVFIEIWNDHSIHKQPNRPHVVHGRPFMNYFYPNDQVPWCGFPVNSDQVEKQQKDVQEFSMYNHLSLSITLICFLDLDEYLPSATLQWCHMTLMKHNIHPDFAPPSEETVSPYHEEYLTLREAVKTSQFLNYVNLQENHGNETQ